MSWLFSPVAQAEPSEALSSEEQTRLAAGELIVRPSTQKKGKLNLIGGTSWQVIDAAPDQVWQALLDTPNYTHMLPRVESAKLVERKTDERLVYLQHRTGLITASYYLRLKAKRDKGDITFAIDDKRPHTITAAWGFYAVRPFGPHKTLLAYGVMADIGGGLFTGLMRDSVQRSMLKVPRMIKQFVEDGQTAN